MKFVAVCIPIVARVTILRRTPSHFRECHLDVLLKNWLVRGEIMVAYHQSSFGESLRVYGLILIQEPLCNYCVLSAKPSRQGWFTTPEAVLSL